MDAVFLPIEARLGQRPARAACCCCNCELRTGVVWLGARLGPAFVIMGVSCVGTGISGGSATVVGIGLLNLMNIIVCASVVVVI